MGLLKRRFLNVRLTSCPSFGERVISDWQILITLKFHHLTTMIACILISAIGCYENYLEVGRLILFPIFEVQNNKDQVALNVIKKLFPDRIIEYVNINEIDEEGGLLNCISGTVER